MTFTASDARTFAEINERAKENELWGVIKSLSTVGVRKAIFESIPGGLTQADVEAAGFTVENIYGDDGELHTIIIKW